MPEIKIKDTSKETFSEAVEEKAKIEQISYIEALSDILEECDAEPKILAKLLTKSLKEKIHQEASELNLLKESNKEPTLSQ